MQSLSGEPVMSLSSLTSFALGLNAALKHLMCAMGVTIGIGASVMNLPYLIINDGVNIIPLGWSIAAELRFKISFANIPKQEKVYKADLFI